MRAVNLVSMPIFSVCDAMNMRQRNGRIALSCFWQICVTEVSGGHSNRSSWLMHDELEGGVAASSPFWGDAMAPRVLRRTERYSLCLVPSQPLYQYRTVYVSVTPPTACYCSFIHLFGSLMYVYPVTLLASCLSVVVLFVSVCVIGAGDDLWDTGELSKF